MAYSHQREYQPLFTIGKLPVWITTICTALFALGVIATALLQSARVPVQPLAFVAPTFFSGAIWQPLTYVWVDYPTFFTVFGLIMFYSIGIEFERYFARSGFLKLFGSLIAVEVLVSILFWFAARVIVTPIGTRGMYGLSGNYHLIAGMIVAFATLYPNLEYLGWLPLKWFAFACIAIGSLMYFPERNWSGLTVYFAVCLTGFLYVRYQTGALQLPSVRMPSLGRRSPKLRVLPDPRSRDEGGEEEDSSMPEVDALLDKIARSGIGSLTAREREKLERAREELLRRETPRR
jgi:hypothetical protein